jgi:glycerol-3-phosphate O-acyltransferase
MECTMSREELLHELSDVASLIEAKPWWQQNLLDESSKSTSDNPREQISNLAVLTTNDVANSTSNSEQ